MSLFDFFRPSSPVSGRTKKATLQFRGHELVVIRRARRRTMTISMRPHEPMRVTTSLSVTDAQIRRFLEGKWSWIERNLNEFAHVPHAPKRIGAAGEIWMYRGRRVVVKDAITLLKQAFVVWGEEDVFVYWPVDAWVSRAEHRDQALRWLEKSLREEAESLLTERVKIQSQRMQLFPKRLRFMRARTRWGSCSSRGSLNLNWKLIGAPIEVVDSIVVHELAHLRHMNHSKDFWGLVESFDPDYHRADEWLREHQAML